MGIPEIREGTLDSVINGILAEDFIQKIKANQFLGQGIALAGERMEEEFGKDAAYAFLRLTLTILKLVDSELDSREMEAWLS